MTEQRKIIAKLRKKYKHVASELADIERDEENKRAERKSTREHRNLVQETKKAAKGTIRADFAQSIDANAVHGSDSVENAAVEIAYFFPASDIYSR